MRRFHVHAPAGTGGTSRVRGRARPGTRPGTRARAGSPGRPPAPASAGGTPHGPARDAARATGPGTAAPRRGRTALLLACAALLGTVGGLAGGYTVQADRAPTPLPPLSQAELSYPKKPLPEDEAPEPLTA
ncbi:hypothetical protein [Streptomyces verrucosisporus]|uniref:hypothetical protein n=1 Tax=Streptomyces verrucosisporus TaxID=1695161 RepID=UPI001F126085|nr:hypothetical protein [Streptomyces verrucosisporus]